MKVTSYDIKMTALIFSLGFILMALGVQGYGSYNQTEFSTGEPNATMNWRSPPVNQTVYITLPRNFNASVSFVNGTGYNWTTVYYQENANSSAMGTNNWQNVANIYDGNWNSYGDSADGTSSTHSFNYSLPPNLVGNPIFTLGVWTIGDVRNGTVDRAVCQNNPDIKINIYSNDLNTHVKAACVKFDGYSEYIITADTSGAFADYVFEEGIYWNIYGVPTNIKLDVGSDGNYDYINDTTFLTSEIIELDPNVINNYLRHTCTSDFLTGTCDVPINGSSDTQGQFIMTDLDIQGSYISGYYNISIYDEMTDSLYNLDDLDDVTFQAYCPDETVNFSITSNPTNNISIDCAFTELRLVLKSGSSTHWRTLIPEYGFGDVKFYMGNFSRDTIRTLNLYIQDISNTYQGATMSIKKTIGEGEDDITDQLLDAESKVILHLIDNEKYRILINDEDLGYLIADSSTDKTITVSSIDLVPENTMTAGLRWIFNETDDFVYLHYIDERGQTMSLMFEVFNATNTSKPVLYNETYIGSTKLFTYPKSNNHTFLYVCMTSYRSTGLMYYECRILAGNENLAFALLDEMPQLYIIIAVFIALFILTVCSIKTIKWGLVGAMFWLDYTAYNYWFRYLTFTRETVLGAFIFLTVLAILYALSEGDK